MLPPEDARKRTPEPLQILVVEDDAAVVETVSAFLRRGGYDVIVARDGRSALAAVTSVPSVAVVDVRLPDMSGLDLIEPFRAAAPGLPVIIITAWPNPDTYAEAMRRGAVACLSKPFSLWNFGIILQQILRANWLPGAQPWQPRYAFRATLELPLTAHRPGGDQPLHGQLRDLSHTGAMLVLSGQVETGDLLVVNLGSEKEPVRLEGSVVWNREDALHPGVYLHGLQFNEPRPLEFAHELARRIAPLPRQKRVEEIM